MHLFPNALSPFSLCSSVQVTCRPISLALQGNHGRYAWCCDPPPDPSLSLIVSVSCSALCFVPLSYRIFVSSSLLFLVPWAWPNRIIDHDRSTNGQKGYDVTQLIAEADEDGTGSINLSEFCNHMRKRCGRMKNNILAGAARPGVPFAQQDFASAFA